MAKTFIGELVLRFKDDSSAGAKRAAQNIKGSVADIEAAARRFNQTSWGGKFEQQMRKLGASSSDLDHLRASWNRLYAEMSQKNLSAALQRSQVSNWKTAATGHFAQIAIEAQKTEAKVRKLHGAMMDVKRLALSTAGTVGGMYLGGQGIRSGFTASANWEREKFRQSMGNIPDDEKQRLISRSEELGVQYPSVSITDIAEMGRKGRGLMGSTDRGLEILPDMVRAYVTLQSSKGLDAATSEMDRFMKGIDNIGLNQNGPAGIKDTKDIIAAWVRASQIEGSDLDIGKFLEFAKQSKIAGPALSLKFLSSVLPVVTQDMGADKVGTMLSSAYSAFVIGSNANSGKVNLQAQRDLGIRTGEGKGSLVGEEIYSSSPYEWVKSILIPALEKKGIDTSNDSAVAKAVANLSRNSNATTLLTRLIQQRQQIDRSSQQFDNAQGPEAADQARFKDPFVAFEGFTTAFRNLAAAMGEDTMPTIIAGLNGLAGGVNNLQQMWRDGDPLAKTGLAAGGIAAGLLSWKAVSGIYSLTTAGPALNVAAASLEAAAISLGAGGVAGSKGNAAKAGGNGWLASGLGLLGSIGTVVGLGVAQSGSARTQTPEEHDLVVKNATLEWIKSHQDMMESPRVSANRVDQREVTLGAAADDSRSVNAFQGFEDRLSGRRPAVAADTGTPVAETAVAQPSVDTSALQTGVTDAQTAGQQIKDALSPVATPVIDLSALQSAVSLAERFVALMSRATSLAATVPDRAGGDVNRMMNRNFTDQGGQ